MAGFVMFLFFAVIAASVWRALASRHRPQVHDAEGHRVFPAAVGADAGRWLAAIAVPFVLLLVLGSSFRVVPVGHALVIFNTVTRSFRVAPQGITFVAPFIFA